MNTSGTVVRLSWLIAALALVASLAGLFTGGGSGPSGFTTVHGQHVALYGQGLYRADTLLIGSGFRGQDLVMLALGLPLLLLATSWYRAGSWRGALLLGGTLAYVLYVYASMVFAAAYNPLFLLYVALFSASLYALVVLLTSLDARALTRQLEDNVPRRATANFMFIVGAVLLIVWGGLSLLPALLSGGIPAEVASYTTLVTHALDLGVIVPAVLLTGALLRARAPLGDLLAPVLLVMSALLGVTIATATIAQLLAGYPYTTAQVATMAVPFVLLALVGMWLALQYLNRVPRDHVWRHVT